MGKLLYIWLMHLVETVGGHKVEAIIEPVTTTDFRTIKKSKRFPDFNWDKEKKNEVYKLRLLESEAILGLLSLVYFENWIKINLLQSSIENIGEEKQYDRIAGCLIAYACRIAFRKGFDGFVALEPKTTLAQHYINKYNFQICGRHINTELGNSELLIQEYLNDDQ